MNSHCKNRDWVGIAKERALKDKIHKRTKLVEAGAMKNEESKKSTNYKLWRCLEN